jgi:two-component system sensor histidine kinase HydH
MSSRFTLLIAAPVTVISLLLVVVGGAAAWYVHRMNKEVSELLAQELACAQASEKLFRSIQDVRAELNRFARTKDPSYLASAGNVRKETVQILQQLVELHDSTPSTTPAVHQLLERTRANHERFSVAFATIADQPTAPDIDRQVHTLIDELTDDVLAPAQGLLEYNRKAVAQHTEDNRVLADRIGLGLLALGSCGAVAGLLAGFGIARGISRSLVQLSVPIRDTAGKLNEVVGPINLTASTDLSELETVMRTIADETNAVVQRLQQSQHEALRSEQLAAVGQLAAGMAHELRNPLTAMKILVQAAAEQAGDPSLRGRDLTVLEEEITRLEHLIQTFLDFARPPKLEKKSFDVRKLVDQTVHLVTGPATQQGVRIQYDQPTEPLIADADPIQIRQVLLNLLLNALDALPSGGNVSVHMRATGPQGAFDGSQLVLEVADDGRGLPGDLRERIFDPFVSTKETGIGLGLSVCKRIVEAHGGRITAENRPEGGAVFTVRLPMADIAEMAATTSKVAAP